MNWIIFEDTGERRYPVYGETYLWLKSPFPGLDISLCDERDDPDWVGAPQDFAILRFVPFTPDAEKPAVPDLVGAEERPVPWCHYCDCWHGPLAQHISVRTITSTLEGIQTRIYHKHIVRSLLQHSTGEWTPITIFGFDQVGLAIDGLNSVDAEAIQVAVANAPKD